MQIRSEVLLRKVANKQTDKQRRKRKVLGGRNEHRVLFRYNSNRHILTVYGQVFMRNPVTGAICRPTSMPMWAFSRNWSGLELYGWV